jgi:folate-binding protein YgfZ
MSALGVIDRSARGRLRLTGQDRVRFLQGMLTSDVAALAPGQSQRAALLTPKGRVVADMIVLAQADAFLVTTDPELREKLGVALDHYVVMDDVVIEDVTAASAEGAVYGPGARELLGRAAAAGLAPLEVPLGLHVVGAAEAVARFLDQRVGEGARRLDEAACEVMRVERGVTRYSIEITEEVLPLEAGLDDAISLTKGCYVGQEPVARVTARGHVNKKIVGLRCEQPVEPGQVVAGPERPEAGQVTSACESAAAGGPIALAYLHRSLWEPGTAVRVGPAGSPATVAALPFVDW